MTKYERAVRLHNKAAKYHAGGDPVRPEKLYPRALTLKEEVLGPGHPEVAVTLCNLGLFYKALGRLATARPLYERALGIFQLNFGATHDTVATALFNLAQLLAAEAEAMAERASRVQRDAAEMGTLDAPAIRQDRARFRLTARLSRIHRFGVFADEAIPAGARVIEYTGERVARREAVRRCAAGRTYLKQLDSYWSLDGSAGGSGAELINHCCGPNCRFDTENGAVWVVSLRAIEPGEELLLDYKFPATCEMVACYCGARSCRGTINLYGAPQGSIAAK